MPPNRLRAVAVAQAYTCKNDTGVIEIRSTQYFRRIEALEELTSPSLSAERIGLVGRFCANSPEPSARVPQSRHGRQHPLPQLFK